MDYKGYELRFGVRWNTGKTTHSAAVGVFKGDRMVAPCADIHLAQRWVDQRIKSLERQAKNCGEAGRRRDSTQPERVRKSGASRKRV